jgi:predicted DNA-binding protein (UPF0251 family)
LTTTELAEEPRAHTYGRAFTKALDNIREVAAMWYEPEDIEVKPRLADRDDINDLVEEVSRLRLEEERLRTHVFDLTAEVAWRLVNDLQLSMRDAAELLGISHQRVHQLVKAAAIDRAS